MDITPLIPKGHQIIQSYTETGFKIGGKAYEGGVLVEAEKVTNLTIPVVEDLDLSFFKTLDFSNIDLLLVGTGTTFKPFSTELKSALQNAFDIKLDFMTTGAACRTYNVLLAEGREVGSLLYPLG
jgi:uncharacterized protein